MKKQNYFIAMCKEAGDVQTRTGYCFHLGDGLNVGLTRDYYDTQTGKTYTGRAWIVSELSTGAKMGEGASVEKALQNVLARVHELGHASLQRAINCGIETLNARGITAPLNAGLVPAYDFLTVSPSC